MDPILLDLPFPILTPRLLIRPWAPGDGRALHEAKLESIEALKPWMPWANGPITLEGDERSCREAHARFILREEMRMFFLDRGTGALIGSGGLHRIDWQRRLFDIGYWIRASRAGRGYVTEATNAVARYAFGCLGARRVGIQCNVGNAKSRAVAERLGFELEGILKNDDRFAGPEVECRDHAVYARVSADGLPALDVRW